ncbi:GNAT family N-acetyltransferase [Papillibacter cinnamivorans]|uniref:Protein N-acetyltransferase, RimJ/RimL family n=1 Tax=Papillibacter cinnamivorans DSM 12816 TaxID=1122930 RepID=A0A1W2AYA1_9FIRM|nr:GNAT family protein [Papillibacter cinnamivorans]SMC65594.1 Protein N-acetyltransferase, RimJ/RimL family [Papillibacter cinnamivorans DSM 12816]
MKSFTPLRTERLVLRRLSAPDAGDFFRYRSLPEVCAFQPFRPKSVREAAGFIAGIAQEPDIPGTWFQLALCLKEGGGLIGDAGIHFIDADQAEIGYTLAPAFQGRGYATEGAAAMFAWLFRDLKKHRITASVDPENTRSVRLLQRLGMRREAHFVQSIRLNDRWTDDLVFAILREEWEQTISENDILN